VIALERLSLYLVELPLVHPFATSFGEERVRRALLLSLEGDGIRGWGECVAGAGPWYSPETVETARHVIRDFALSFLSGARLSHPRELSQLLSPIRGHPMAKAALEAALWDLYARAEGIPLWRALGGVREEVPAGVSIGIQKDIPSLLDRVAGFVEQGYQRVKLKVKPGWDLEVLKAVRERFPEVPLSVDANAAYTLDDAERLRAFDRFGLMMVEQPLHHEDLLGHARLGKTISTPICLDESIHSPRRAWEALELGSCRIINVKQGGWGASRPPSRSTGLLGPGGCRCGAGECWRPGWAGRSTSPWPPCRGLPSPTTSPPRTGTIGRTSPSRHFGSRPGVPSPCRRGQGSGWR